MDDAASSEHLPYQPLETPMYNLPDFKLKEEMLDVEDLPYKPSENPMFILPDFIMKEELLDVKETQYQPLNLETSTEILPMEEVKEDLLDLKILSKRGNYGVWKEDDMERAVMAFRNGDMGLNAAARMNGVPKATLKRRLDGVNINAVGNVQRFGRGIDIPKVMEDELADHVLRLKERFFEVTRDDLRRLAFEVAEANNIPHRFNKEKAMAGDKWYYGFISRHPQISLRQPEPTYRARARGFNKERVNAFFTVLGKLLDDNQLDACTIFNMDETTLSTIHKPQKNLAQRGKHQVSAIPSGERGTNTTCVCCMSAAGFFVPPMLIFKRLRFKVELSEGAPPGTQFACTKSGWVTSNVFVQWLKYFIEIVKPSKKKKTLLVLDGHSTHIKNLEAIELARENGIILLSIPAHTTHRLQPLDVGLFKPLSTFFTEASDKWMRVHPGRTISQFQISQLLGEAYGRAASVKTAINAFKKSGIWPFNPDIFCESDFVPSTIVESTRSAIEPNDPTPSTSSSANGPVEQE